MKNKKKIFLIILIIGLLISGGLGLKALRQSSPNEGGLVGYWTLDEDDLNNAGDTIKDKSSNGNDGMIAVTPATFEKDQNGVPNQAMSFDGVGDYVTVDDPASGIYDFNDFSVSFWLNPTTFEANDRVIAKGTTSNGNWMISASVSASNRIRVYAKDTNGNVKDTTTSLGTVPLSTWSFNTIIIDRTNNEIIHYINGIEVSDFSGGDTWDASFTNNNDLTIGINSSGSAYFDGSISDVAIYNKALSDQEVQQLYKAGRTTAKVKVNAKNLVTNGAFDTDTDWTKQSDWTISGGRAHCSGISSNRIDQVNVFEPLRTYRISFEYTTLSSSGYLRVKTYGVSGWDLIGPTPIGIGSGSVSFEHTTKVDNNGKIYLNSVSNWEGSIDNVSVVDTTNKVTPKLQKGLILDMPLAEPYTEANNTIVKDRTPNGNDGTVNGATVKYDGLVNTAGGVAYIPSTTAYGTWEWDFNTVTNIDSYVNFISDGYDTTYQNKGYQIYYDSYSTNENRILLRASDGVGGKTVIFSTADNIFSGSTDYRIKITRSLAGVFIIYLKGGAYGWDDWTQIGTGTDTDNDESTYFSLDVGTSSNFNISNLKIDGKKVSLNKATVSSGSFTTTAPSYEFDGIDDYISIDSNNIGKIYTISLWANLKAFDRNLLGISAENSMQFRPVTSTSFRHTVNSNPVLFATNYNLNQWYNFVIVRNGVSVKYYQDGVLVDSEKTLASNDDFIIDRIGGTYNTGVYTKGQISGLKIWNRVLSASEINYLYSKERINY